MRLIAKNIYYIILKGNVYFIENDHVDSNDLHEWLNELEAPRAHDAISLYACSRNVDRITICIINLQLKSHVSNFYAI